MGDWSTEAAGEFCVYHGGYPGLPKYPLFYITLCLMNMDRLVNKFRVASRELFNNHFLETFLENEDWAFHEHFTLIEEHLFLALVTSISGISEVTYGRVQPEILVTSKPEAAHGIPIMLNREIDSGYWDHPIDVAIPGCIFLFVSFFDWDEMSYKDNRYVRAIVRAWPENPALIGKHALIETHHVSYSKA